MTIKKKDLFGLMISIFSEEQLYRYFESIFESNKSHILYGYSVGLFPYLKKYPEIIEYSNTFDLMVTDGKIFYLLAKMNNVPVEYNISIPRMVIELLKIANEKGLKVLLFGAEKSINKKATENMRQKYPDAKIIDGIDGYFNKNEEQIIKDKILTISPDILLIGMHSPYKESFAFKNKNNLNCKVIIPCGGMIDVLAGKTKITPKWIKSIGMAWFYRLLQQPVKRFKITSHFIFLFFKVLFAKNVLKKDNNTSILEII